MYFLDYKRHAIFSKAVNYLLRTEILKEKEYCRRVLDVRPQKQNTRYGFINHIWCSLDPRCGQEIVVMVKRFRTGARRFAAQLFRKNT
jgi:hypothetical protein